MPAVGKPPKPPANNQPAVALKSPSRAEANDKPKSPGKPSPVPVKPANSPANNQPAIALKSPSHAEAKSPDKRPAVRSHPGAPVAALLREPEHQSPVKPKPAVVKAPLVCP